MEGLSTLEKRVDTLIQETDIAPKSGFSWKNPILYVVIGFIIITVLLLYMRPKMITVEVETDDGTKKRKLSYKKVAIAVVALAAIAGGIIFYLTRRNKI
jgi:hypothetical protein